MRLAQLGRRIEAHFGRPQDIEWCLVDDGFQIVQSRPITTLFPIPAAGDRENHVYVSVGHQQMMTDAMKPLGLSFWQLTTPRPMAEAGGRLFVDVTQAPGFAGEPRRPPGAHGEVRSADQGRAADHPRPRRLHPVAPGRGPGGPPPGGAPAPIETDPAIVAELIGRSQASIAALKRDIRTKSGSALLDFILADIQELKRILFDPQSHQVFMAAMEATWWLNEQLQAWLGEKNAADTLTQSVPDNVTSEMGLALLDVADVIRPHPEVVAFLQHVEDEGFLDELAELAGGREARDAIRAFLDKYGMRCVGEIDITRPRWSERPTTLVPMILGNIKNFEPGAGERRFEQGRQEAWKKEQELLERLRALPDGERKAEETKRMIDRVRTFIGYREYPKYGMVSRYFVYKQALLEEAERLVQARVLREKEDIFYLTFQELHDVVRTNHVDDQLIRQRKDAFRSYQALTPPRVLTSDGEGIAGAYRRDDVPAGALVGLPVSAGTIEGRARVILDMAEADLEAGRHPGHRLHGPQLDAPVRRDQGPGDGGGGPDDPRRGDRTGVRLAGRRGGGACHPADPGRAADPRAWNGRVRRDPALSPHGDAAVFFSRLLPVIRTFISVPAGVARMNFAKFTIYTILGCLPWTFALAWIGFVLGDNWTAAEEVISPVAWGIALVLFARRHLVGHPAVAPGPRGVRGPRPGTRTRPGPPRGSPPSSTSPSRPRRPVRTRPADTSCASGCGRRPRARATGIPPRAPAP